LSRYQVNKAIRWIPNDSNTRTAFLSDRAGFLDSFQLTDVERKALIEIDYGTLYALGVHPFLLYRFVMSVLTGDRRSLQAEYRKNVTPFGWPDFST